MHSERKRTWYPTLRNYDFCPMGLFSNTILQNPIRQADSKQEIEYGDTSDER